MQQALTAEVTDDTPDRAVAGGFIGFDAATNPTLLEPGIIAAGSNVYLKGDGLARTRPGFVLNSNQLAAAPATSAVVRGLCYYDLPDYEATLAFCDEKVKSIASVTYGVAPATEVSYGGTTVGDLPFVQFIDRIFYIRNGVLNWQMNTAGVWTAGTITTFSDASAMPTWSKIATQGFRLFLMEANGYKLYASAIGAANAAANWVKTENIRVGSGEGDPARALIPSQGRYLTMLTARAAWQIDTTDALVANWSSLRITSLAGCVEGKAAIAVGQDVYFLSRVGIVNLGSLRDTVSIAPQFALSAPIQPYIDRINWSAIDKAFATTWQELVIFALPLDSNTRPKDLFAYNLATRQWCAPWSCVPGTNTASGIAFGGWTCATVANFGDKAETLIADDTGRVFYLDTTGNYNGFDDDGSGDYHYIATTLTTRAFTHDAPEARKQALLAEVEAIVNFSSGPAIFGNTLQLIKENGYGTATLSSGFSIGGTPYQPGQIQRARFNARGLASSLGSYRDAQLKLTMPSGRMNLRSLSLTSYVDATDIAT